MFLKALVTYYELLCSDPKSGIAPLGFSPVKVSYEAVISKNGDLKGLTSLKRLDGKKSVPVEMMLPKSVLRSSGISSNFLYDNATYVFGIDKGDPERAKKCFESFKNLHESMLKDVQCEEAEALLAFLNKWDSSNAAQNKILAPEISELAKGANIVFRLDGKKSYIHENPQIKERWAAKENETSDEPLMQCLVTGEESAPTRLHTAIKGLYKGLSSGNQFISFNANAYESYGKEDGQGLNAPISKYAAFAYATALNYLIAKPNHNIRISDTTMVFWAERESITFDESEEIANIFLDFVEPQEKDENVKKETVADEYAAEKVRGYFNEISKGNLPKVSEELEDVRFYILGISPNSARISVKFFMRDSLGNFIKQISQHYLDMQIEKQYSSNKENFPIWLLLKETVSPKASKGTLPHSTMSNALMRAVLNGEPYPYSLYSAVISRIRAGDDIGYYKAAIIKGYLIRSKREKYKEVLTMSLNPDYDAEVSYLLGRLFAVLEKLQIESSGAELNTTIRDRFFTSACSTPANVFPSLLRLSSHHISKAEYGKQHDKRISEIMEKLDVNKNPFPKTLSIEQQGIFILGYYHQKNAFYAGK
ncbi:MAG: CRISPR-associated protein Csd1 family [Oscillospiraceae bacterium]|jgi:CRISPR-associated protein Csd1|nr:CRISPR-associated protein Csd1 family [Oscillospiraceae bacterium]